MGLLKGIPSNLSPELLYALAKMGHGDEIVLGDANFPSRSICKAGPELVDATGHDISSLLESILKLFPLDIKLYANAPVALMDLVPSDKERSLDVPVWSSYQEICNKAAGSQVSMEKVERFAFYRRAKEAFAIVATGETALYGNIILKKGVIPKTNDKM